jgi:hypothetical protein
MQPRSTLKDYFKKGAIPKESDFADLIDSMLIQDEDSILKLPNDPLSIKATGAEEALLNFYRVENNANTTTWQLKQKPGGKLGLSIHDGADSRLFIESGTGNVGIGTITPGAKLEVSGATSLNGGLTVTGQTKLSAAVSNNRAPIANQHLVITPTAGNIPLNVTSPDNTMNWLSVFPDGNVIMNGGKVGIGTTTPQVKLHIEGGDMFLRQFPADDTTASSTAITLVNRGRGGIDIRWSLYTAAVGGGWGIQPNAFEIWQYDPPTPRFRILPNGDTMLAVSGGNVGIGTTAPKAKLTISGDLIRKVAIATGLGPEDDTDNGQIVSRVLTFTKHYADTAIRILYCDNLRVWDNLFNAPATTGTAARWEIRIDGKSVPGGAIYQDKYADRGNDHAPATILGYATGIGAGAHTIGVWVSSITSYVNNAYTGWHDSRWTIEAQEVWI